MRYAAIALLVFTLALPAAVAAAIRPAGTLQISDARGVVTIKGRGAVLGRIDRGSLQILDLSPLDAWSPRVNGIPRGRVVGMRGRDVSFYIPGGRYRIVVRGEGISISARGNGFVILDGEPDATGATGTYAIGDQPPEPLPVEPARVPFGVEPEPTRSS